MYLLRLHSWRSTMFWLALRLPMPGHCLRSDILYSTTGFVNIVQSPSRVQLFVTPWTAACQVSLSLTISWSLPKFMSIASVMPSSHLILWCPLLLLPSIFPSIRGFPNESAVRIRCPKYWSFIFSISLSNDYSGLTSLKIGWLDFLAVQGALRSLLQHHSLKAVIHSLYGSPLITVRDHWEDIALT